MSGKWAEFDPLSRARAAPAAPVTSLQQAEVKPMQTHKPRRHHELKSTPESPPTASHEHAGAEALSEQPISSHGPESEATRAPQGLPSPGPPAESDLARSTGLAEGASLPSDQDAEDTKMAGMKEERASVKAQELGPADNADLGTAGDASDGAKAGLNHTSHDGSNNDDVESGVKHSENYPDNEPEGLKDGLNSLAEIESNDECRDSTKDSAKQSAKSSVHLDASEQPSVAEPAAAASNAESLPGSPLGPAATEPELVASDSELDPKAEVSANERAEASAARIANGSGEESSSWPTKLVLEDTDAADPTAEPHHGDLRKNSIAAMKELGAPDRSSSGAQTPEEELPFDFQRFMGLLRSRSADPIARYVKSFLQEFSRGAWTPQQQEKIVADFQRFIGVKMREFEPFASLGKRDRRNAAEGMEKLVMNRLYTRTFPPKMPPVLRTDGHNEDLLRDSVFEEKLRLWSWVEGRHLDINEAYLQSGFIQLASNELTRLHQFKSPRDKTICVLNCSKVVWALIRQAQLEQNADSFLPLLIYVVLKAQPVHLVSNLNYIQRYRSKDFLKGETAYYLSTLASAVTFLETLDKSSLTISDEEFEQKMKDSVRRENEHRAELEQQRQGRPLGSDAEPGEFERHHEGESSAAVIAASAGMLVERMRNFTTKFLEDLSTPEDTDAEDRGTAGGDGTGAATAAERHQQVRQARRQYRDEEQAAREASREEFRTEELQRQQFNETSATLQQMFPDLDSDVVEDVLRQSGTNIGSAVDVCLALVGTT